MGEEGDLAEAFAGLLSRVEQRSGIATSLSAQGDGSLSPVVEREVARIAQEAINNAERHAGAQHIDVRWRCEKLGAELEVVDDGRGMAATAPLRRGTRSGSWACGNEPTQSAASLAIVSPAGQGTTVRLRLGQSVGLKGGGRVERGTSNAGRRPHGAPGRASPFPGVAGLSVVADVGDGDEVLEARQSQPNVVLMDISLPGKDGIEVTRQLSRQLPQTAVVVLTMFADEATVRAAFEAGAVGYLVKDCTTAEILSTVTAAAQGSGDSRGEVARSFLRASARLANRPMPNHSLTTREVEVMQMLANGDSTGDAARKLFISAKTVKNHLAHIYSKLGAESRTQAVAKAVRLGIVRIG